MGSGIVDLLFALGQGLTESKRALLTSDSRDNNRHEVVEMRPSCVVSPFYPNARNIVPSSAKITFTVLARK